MKNPSSYLKMKVMGAIEYADGATIREKIQNVSTMQFVDEDGNPRQFTWRTISTWFYRYKSNGITGVLKKQRKDLGITRKITPEELLEAINSVLPYFRDKKKYNKTDIYRKCIETGRLHSTQIAPTTFYRFVREYELLKDNVENNKKRLAFSMQYANQLWQADTMYGPYVKDKNNKPIQTKMITFLDDASRVVCHSQFFFQENIETLVSALKSAFYKRGIPEQLYVDNGSVYVSSEITLICARIGCILRHAPLRDGAAKGKVERYHRTVRGSFLSRNLDLSSLDQLNRQYTEWVETCYNNSTHSAIGIKPVDRFAFDLKRIRFLEPNGANDELFYNEVPRKVKKDNTFSFKNIRFEAPADLRDKLIQIRYDRNHFTEAIVYYKSRRMGIARKVNLIANGQLKRARTNNQNNNKGVKK
jgi:transposase InsO family protein